MELVERYEHVECRKAEGAHYTPEKLSDFVATQILEKAEKKAEVIIADPAIGDGELILSVLNKINPNTKLTVVGFDVNPASIQLSRDRISSYYPNVRLKLISGDFLDYCLNVGTTLEETTIPKFDLLIANPPYIRTQVLGAEQAQLLSKNFGLKGRVDIYQAFLIGMSKFLAPNSTAGVIVSNRFLTTKGTGELRKALYSLYNIHKIWDFGDTKLFEAAVLPAVLLFSPRLHERKTITEFSSIYETNEKASGFADDAIDAISQEGVISCPSGKSYVVKKGRLAFDTEPKDIWRIQDSVSEEWLDKVQRNTWATFRDVGKVRVGVKTTADNVFIKSSWIDEAGCEPELLMPLITHHVAGRFKQGNSKLKKILYTHEMINGKKAAVDIEKYPISKNYLQQHREQLEGRNYVIKAKRNWYEIWVPQSPDLWKKNKIVFRDICEQPTFWFDEQGSIVNGDCYWMINEGHQDNEDILWLALAIANSSFIEEFYDVKFNNKLYSNKRRFISQYVEMFPLPDPTLENSLTLISLSKKVYLTQNDDESAHLQKQINELVWRSFGLPVSKI